VRITSGVAAPVLGARGLDIGALLVGERGCRIGQCRVELVLRTSSSGATSYFPVWVVDQRAPEKRWSQGRPIAVPALVSLPEAGTADGSSSLVNHSCVEVRM
jgi:hypothetical protein